MRDLQAARGTTLTEEAGDVTSHGARQDDVHDGDAPASAAAHVGAPAAPRSPRLTVLMFGLAAGVAIVDQLTKQLALSSLELGASTTWFLGELLGWKLLLNPGAALSMGTGFTWVLTLLTVAVVVVIATRARRITSRAWAVSLALVLGGAVGNLIDRLFRAPGFPEGHVVDFINYAGFFVGNVADIAIVAAAGLLIVLSFRGTPMTGGPEDSGESAAEAHEEGGPTVAPAAQEADPAAGGEPEQR